jgi:hypothetical protein
LISLRFKVDGSDGSTKESWWLKVRLVKDSLRSWLVVPIHKVHIEVISLLSLSLLLGLLVDHVL